MSLYKKRRGPDITDRTNLVTIFIGLITVAVILSLLIRLQRGLLGIVLGSLATIIAVYWIFELRKTLRSEFKIKATQTKGWSHDLIEDMSEILIVGKVPGPQEKIEVLIHEDLVEVKGGSHFRELIRLPSRVISFNTAYNNGILEIRLKK